MTDMSDPSIRYLAVMSFPTPNLKKKPKRTVLSLIILSIPNISHGKDNFTPNCMPNKFL